MNKYLAVLIGMCISLNVSANSYVFGGRAHFSGSLVNSGCVVTHNIDLRQSLSGEPTSNLGLNISNCSSTIYYNLRIALKHVSNTTKVSILQSMDGMNSNFTLETHSLHSSLPLVGFRRSEDIARKYEPELTNIDETVVLPLSKLNGQSTENSTNILISVFYP